MSDSRTSGERLRLTGLRALTLAAELAHRGQRALQPNGGSPLQGDRWVEWSFCFARMAEGAGTTLDFGADIGFLALAAAQRGHDVVALDRMPPSLDYSHERVTPLQADILDHPLGDRRFDQIFNCSSIEHVGLGGRYGSGQVPDGDLQAMAILREALAQDGRMILTIPVGRDQVCAPFHRIYGEERLPRLLDGYDVAEEQFWVRQARAWTLAGRNTALATTGSRSFYALGLFVLTDGNDR